MPRRKYPENEKNCYYCNKDKPYIYSNWYLFDGHRCCLTCYNNKNPHKNNPITIRKNNKRRMKFLGKHVYLEENPRIGICSWCGKVNGERFLNVEGNIGIIITHMHHWFYLPIMVWACTEELCNSCHRAESNRLLSPG